MLGSDRVCTPLSDGQCVHARATIFLWFAECLGRVDAGCASGSAACVSLSDVFDVVVALPVLLGLLFPGWCEFGVVSPSCFGVVLLGGMSKGWLHHWAWNYPFQGKLRSVAEELPRRHTYNWWWGFTLPRQVLCFVLCAVSVLSIGDNNERHRHSHDACIIGSGLSLLGPSRLLVCSMTITGVLFGLLKMGYIGAIDVPSMSMYIAAADWIIPHQGSFNGCRFI